MPAATLVPCLVQLRTEINRVCPDRDKTSDGVAGDAAHQATVSDHNNDETGRVPIRDADTIPEYHALDVDADLRQSDLTMRKIVDHILARCRSGAEQRLRYMIFDGMIWEASNGWRKRAYSGTNPHRQHAHFSASYDTKHEASKASWRIEEIPVSLTDADKRWLESTIDKAATTAAERVWKKKLNVNVGKGQAPSMQEAGSIHRYGSSEHHRAIDAAEETLKVVNEIKAALPTTTAG
jgi:hypothetical protein